MFQGTMFEHSLACGVVRGCEKDTFTITQLLLLSAEVCSISSWRVLLGWLLPALRNTHSFCWQMLPFPFLVSYFLRVYECYSISFAPCVEVATYIRTQYIIGMKENLPKSEQAKQCSCKHALLHSKVHNNDNTRTLVLQMLLPDK